MAFEGEAYGISFIAPFEYDTRTIRFSYSSPAVPSQTYDYDVETRERVLRKQQEIPSGHDPSAYVVRRLFATTADHDSSTGPR